MSNYLAKADAGAKQYPISPFRDKLVEEVQVSDRTTHYSHGEVVSKETDEVLPATHLVKKVTDGSSFLMIYANGIKSMFNLPTAAINVLTILLQVYREANTLKGQPDEIRITYREACEAYGYPYKQQTYINGMNHLIKADFVAAATRPTVFYINPIFFFKGDRYRFVQEYVNDRFSDPKAALPHGSKMPLCGNP